MPGIVRPIRTDMPRIRQTNSNSHALRHWSDELQWARAWFIQGCRIKKGYNTISTFRVSCPQAYSPDSSDQFKQPCAKALVRRIAKHRDIGQTNCRTLINHQLIRFGISVCTFNPVIINPGFPSINRNGKLRRIIA